MVGPRMFQRDPTRPQPRAMGRGDVRLVPACFNGTQPDHNHGQWDEATYDWSPHAFCSLSSWAEENRQNCKLAGLVASLHAPTNTV